MKTYTTSSSNNTINKNLVSGGEYEIVFKDIANIHDPIIKLNSEDMIVDVNYAYIPKFKRYYFITDIEISNNNIYTMRLRCDVLESFKDEILLSKGLVTRNDGGNKYYEGQGLESEVRKEVDVFNSDVILDFKKTKLMVVIR